MRIRVEQDYYTGVYLLYRGDSKIAFAEVKDREDAITIATLMMWAEEKIENARVAA